MAARRGKSQARRNGGSQGGMPGWAWMVLGVVLTVVVVIAAPKLFKSDGEGGFFRPKPNPDAQPAVESVPEDGDVAELPQPAGSGRRATGDAPAGDKPADYDFYTLLPGQEVAMSDAELAATAREEEARRLQAERQQAANNPDAADLAQPAGTPAATAADPAADPAATPAAAASTAAAGRDDVRYILQAGSFSASGDAEALKARIALLGLGARVESADIGGKTVYRVRMGPYGTASELAEAKQKLGSGGLPAMPIKAQ